MLRLLASLLLLLSTAARAELLWHYSTDGMIAGNPVVHKSGVYVTAGNGLHALNLEGALQWKYQTAEPSRSTVAIGDGAIYVLADNGLHALDMNGGLLWLFETRDGPLEVEGTTMGWGEGMHTDPWAWYRSAPLIVGDSVIFSNRRGTYSVDAKSGEQLWHAETGVSHTRPAHHEGIIVVGSWDNHLYGLKVSDGSVAWKTAARLPQGKMAGWLGWEGFNLDPVIHEGVVYAGTRGTYFYAIDATTGMENWSWKHPTSWIGSSAIVSNGVIYFGLSDGNCLVGLETRMGNQSLLFRNRFLNFARPQANSNHVFMASLSGELFRIDRATGKGERIFATLASKENLVEMQNPDGGPNYLYSAEGGYTHENATRDVQRMLSGLDSLLSLTLDGDTLYAGSANGNLYAISIR